MRDSGRAALLNALIDGYDDLKRRLARRLGSTELASEALQDTFLRLECGNDVGAVQSPRAYLFRTALNLANNRRVAENRRLTTSEIDALLDVPDDSPDPARIVESRSEIAALGRILLQLSARQRDIVFATFVDEQSVHQIAQRHRVSVRRIQVELREALLYCAGQLERSLERRLPSRSDAHASHRPALRPWTPALEDTG
ncbi:MULTISPECIES: RNA polymerase sigma factor [Bradyrhizobium]|uniref:RNA polymerase sigma factor n=1 Tax=Bradyrhizobium TaxID=374 RepID=UPI0015536A2E|nr:MULTISPECIES: RNA polymerase sigma factor [Bradyrhizobium]NPV19267.1 RNA polymerase sigma factor [Bradyrhizobium aeschynomenes]